MAIKSVIGYKASDGGIHQDKLNALVAEQKIELRGLIQQGYNGVPLKNGTLTVMDAIFIILERSEEIVKVVRKYNHQISRERSKNTGQLKT
jgi:hypothetical protein